MRIRFRLLMLLFVDDKVVAVAGDGGAADLKAGWWSASVNETLLEGGNLRWGRVGRLEWRMPSLGRSRRWRWSTGRGGVPPRFQRSSERCRIGRGRVAGTSPVAWAAVRGQQCWRHFRFHRNRKRLKLRRWFHRRSDDDAPLEPGWWLRWPGEVEAEGHMPEIETWGYSEGVWNVKPGRNRRWRKQRGERMRVV